MFVKIKNQRTDRMQTNDIDSRDRTPWRCTSRLLGACMILFSIGALAQVSVAQDATLTGEWRYKRDAKEESQREEVIDQATQGMNVLIRGRARDLLREKTKPKPTLKITDEGNQVTVEVEKRRVKFRTDGSPVQVRNQVETATIRAKRKDGKLTVESRGQNGVQTIVYTVSDDGTQLFLETTLMVARIGKAVRYKTTYRKTENQ